MSCISPMSIPRPGGSGPRDRITVPCGRCPGCLSRRRAEFAFRCQKELVASKTAFFVTLTYDDEHNNHELSKIDIQLFMKKLRHISSFRYYLVGEYGGKTYRPHYHMLMFNFMPDFYQFDLTLQDVKEKIEAVWQKGFVKLGTVTAKSINYTLKYMLKPIPYRYKLQELGYVLPFSLMSRRPGIGADYVNVAKEYVTEDSPFFRVPGGDKVTISRYYRNKLFHDATKERIAEVYRKNASERIENQIRDAESKNLNYYEQEFLERQTVVERFERKIREQKEKI